MSEEQTLSQERALWTIHKAESGQTYFYNLKTGESQWEKPDCLVEPDEEELDEWQQYTTEDGRAYWYNFKTKESKWQKPVVSGVQVEQEQESDDDVPPDPTREFLLMLHEKEVPITMKWDQAVKALSNDHRWNCIKSISEKKRLFNDYMGDLKKVERDEQKVRLCFAKEEFFKMLEEFKINSSDKKFWQVASALVNDARWKSIPEEKERENLFQDHLDKLYEQERENMRHQRKTSTEDFKKKLQRYVESKMIDHTTTWDQCLKLFSQDRLLQIMMPVDALGVFEEVINPLYEQWRNSTRQKYRNNRIQFREFLQVALSGGQLNHKSKWRDFVQRIREEEVFLLMVGQPGSQPHELFSDFICALRQNHQLYKSELKMVLKQKGVRTLESVQFEQFNNLFAANEAWGKMEEHEKKFYFRYFQENTKNKESQPSSGPKRQKKMLKRLTKLLRQLQIPPNSRYEQIQNQIEESIASDFPKLHALNEDVRRSAFALFMENEGNTTSIAAQAHDSVHKKKKKGKKSKKRGREEEEQNNEKYSVDTESEVGKKQKVPEQDSYEPKIEKVVKKEEVVVVNAPVINVMQEEEDGEIPETADNDVKEGGIEEDQDKKSLSHSKKKKKKRSRGKHSKHKHSEEQSKRQTDKKSKHSKKNKQNYK